MKTLPLLTFAILLPLVPKAEARKRLIIEYSASPRLALTSRNWQVSRSYSPANPAFYPVFNEPVYIQPPPPQIVFYYVPVQPAQNTFRSTQAPSQSPSLSKQLPTSSTAPQKLSTTPSQFADQGIPHSVVQSDQEFLRHLNDESLIPTSDPTLIQVQASLRRRKYYPGSIDGLDGSETQTAIRTYQADRNLPVTGKIDSDLLRDLGL